MQDEGIANLHSPTINSKLSAIYAIGNLIAAWPQSVCVHSKAGVINMILEGS